MGLKLPDKVRIRLICAIFRVTSLYLDRALSNFFPKIKENGEAELAKLKKMNRRDLEKELKKYDHIKDPLDGKLNILFPPWVACIKKKGDCDDLAYLVSQCLRGKIWVIVKSITNSDAGGHVIFRESLGGVWSNARFEGVMPIRYAASKYCGRWKYLIELGQDLKIKKIIKG